MSRDDWPRGPVAVTGAGGYVGRSLDELVRRINPAPVRIRHLPAPVARMLGRLLPQLTPALVEVVLADSLAPHPVETARRFGATLRTRPISSSARHP